MMTLRQFYLAKLAEECQEVAQRALKSMQFGPEEIQPSQSLTNSQRLCDEVQDLLTVLSLVESRTSDISSVVFEERVRASVNKRAKVQKYLEYSQSIGAVERG